MRWGGGVVKLPGPDPCTRPPGAVNSPEKGSRVDDGTRGDLENWRTGEVVDATGAVQDYADSLGIEKGRRVQEVGWDDDCDTAISESVEEFLGEDLLDEETDEVVDVVLLWWREDDGDLVDGLVDAARPMDENGRIWLLTPGAGRPGFVDPGLIDESAQLAGLTGTSAIRLGQWQGNCLVQRGVKRQ